MDENKQETNVVQGNFGQKKTEVTEMPLVMVVNDRQAYRCIDGKTLEIILCSEVKERRPITNAELDMMRGALYLESQISYLTTRYAPHLVYDDYLTYPWLDWPKIDKRLNISLPHPEHPHTLLQRGMWPLVEETRKRLEKNYGEAFTLGQNSQCDTGVHLLDSAVSPFVLRFTSVEQIQDTTLIAEVLEKGEHDMRQVSMLYFKFVTKEQRIAFLVEFLAESEPEAAFQVVYKYQDATNVVIDPLL